MAISSNPAQQTKAGECTQRHFTLAGLKVDRRVLAGFTASFERFNASILTVHFQSGESDRDCEINACVLPLRDATVAWLKKSSWFLPRRTVVYGIGGTREATRFAALGINALLETSNEAGIRAAVEATQPLLSRGIGTCGRVPIATPVKIEAEGRTFIGITKNVGYGGMAVRLLRHVSLPPEIAINFVLPYAGSFSLAAFPGWYSGRLVGLRFQPSVQDEALRQWVLDYSLLGCHQGRLPRAKRASA